MFRSHRGHVAHWLTFSSDYSVLIIKSTEVGDLSRPALNRLASWHALSTFLLQGLGLAFLSTLSDPASEAWSLGCLDLTSILLYQRG